MLRVELVGQNGNTGSRKFIVEKFPVTIGTSREAGVQLTDPEVLPIHCQIEVDGSEIFVRDLGGRQGTYLDGQPVSFARIAPGAKLRVGQSSFIVRPWEPPAPKSQPLSSSAAG